jgi:hypothetical protein
LGDEARLEVRRGAAVLYPNAAVEHGRAAELLGGPGFGLAAFLGGYAVLHGSAVVIDGRVVSFVGPSGTGKSTVAAGAVRAGARFCSDGMTVIDVPTGLCQSGPGRWKLCHDSVLGLGQNPNELVPVWNGSAKRFMNAPCTAYGTITTVLLLERGVEPELRWFTPAEGALQLMAHCYLAHLLLPDHVSLLFERMTRLAGRLRVGRFSRPMAWDRLPELGNWIVDQLRT